MAVAPSSPSWSGGLQKLIAATRAQGLAKRAGLRLSAQGRYRARLRIVRDVWPVLLARIQQDPEFDAEQCRKRLFNAARLYARTKEDQRNKGIGSALIGLLLAVLAGSRLSGTNHDNLDGPLVLSVLLLLSMVTVVLAKWIVLRTIAGLVSLTILGAAGYGYFLRDALPPLREMNPFGPTRELLDQLLAASLYAPVIAFAILALIQLVSYCAASYVRAFWNGRLAEAAAIVTISTLVIEVERCNSLPQIDRSWTIRRLDAASRHTRNASTFLTSRLTRREADVVRERFAWAAEEIWSLRLWVALPGNRSLPDLRERITDMLLVIVSGLYDRLPVPESRVRRARRLHGLAHTARQLLVAAIPAGVLYVAEKVGLALPPDTRPIAVIAVVTWGTVTVLSLLDPSTDERIGKVQGLISVFRPGGKP